MLLILVMLGGVRYLLWYAPSSSPGPGFSYDSGALFWMDSIKTKGSVGNRHSFIYDANNLSDYQGYMLGLTPDQIDRLVRHRVQGNRLADAHAFQYISGITDSLMSLISSRLRFDNASTFRNSSANVTNAQDGRSVADINKVTAAELREIHGIGTVLSSRIVKFRDRLQGFLIDEQLYDVYGLDASVADRVLERYRVLQPPQITPVSLNHATPRELAEVVYLDWDLARAIIAYRNLHERFSSLDELTKIEGFPQDKINRIKLYLSL